MAKGPAAAPDLPAFRKGATLLTIYKRHGESQGHIPPGGAQFAVRPEGALARRVRGLNVTDPALARVADVHMAAIERQDRRMTQAPAQVETSTHASLLERYQRAWSEGDVEAIVSLMTDDGVYEASYGPEPFGRRFIGHDAIREGILEMKRSSPHPNSSHDYGETYLFGDHAFATWTSAWTTPDGGSDSVHGCDLYEFRDGLVSRKIAFRKAVER
jgi:ketosteroid isomerase-like protein